MCRVRDKTHILRNINKDINFKDVTEDYACLGIFGPNSRKFLTELVGDYFQTDLFQILKLREHNYKKKY